MTSEYDGRWGRRGGFHVHTFVQPTRRAVWCPSKRVRDTIERVYKDGQIPISLRDEEGLVRSKRPHRQHCETDVFPQ